MNELIVYNKIYHDNLLLDNIIYILYSIIVQYWHHDIIFIFCYAQVNIDAARIKSIVCLTLTFPVWVTIILLRGKVDYDCTPNNVTGIFYGSLAEDECRFKYVT